MSEIERCRREQARCRDAILARDFGPHNDEFGTWLGLSDWLLEEILIMFTATHGLSDTPEFRIWAGIKKRCCNPKAVSYENYGGRGISLCDEWLNDFRAFLSHVGKRPSPKHSIERIRNDGHYEPGNVRWATRAEQARNTRANLVLELHGERMAAIDWASKVGIPYRTILTRLKAGWSHERTLTERVGLHLRANNRTTTRFIEYAGLRLSMTEWAAKSGLPVSTIKHRLNVGWPIENALNLPRHRGVRGGVTR